VKKIAHAATLALALCGPAQARLIEITTESEPLMSTGNPAQPRAVVILQSIPSDLAEPQMIAMMVLGLCLLGYKASRDSSEKFK
jgi:hypothetical protein